jgi:predicted polyphosphate/ATP-dependent NAD kinase
MSEEKKRIHIVINPAAGKDEPILNMLNDVCRQHKVEWSASVTHKFGDATDYARQATEDAMRLVTEKRDIADPYVPYIRKRIEKFEANWRKHYDETNSSGD